MFNPNPISKHFIKLLHALNPLLSVLTPGQCLLLNAYKHFVQVDRKSCLLRCWIESIAWKSLSQTRSTLQIRNTFEALSQPQPEIDQLL